jgi:hypothetical protein
MVVLITSSASRLKPSSQRSSSPVAQPANRRRHQTLHLRQVAGQRLPREGGHHEGLPLAVLFAVEDRQGAPAEQRLDVRQHPPFALNLAVVDELAGGVGADDDRGRPAEDLRLPHGT